MPLASAIHVQACCRIESRMIRAVSALEATVAHKTANNRAVLLLDEGLSFFLYARDRVTSIFFERHHGMTTSFMKALSLSKSAPAMSHGEQALRPSQRRNHQPAVARHQRQPVATTTIVCVWMNDTSACND